MRLLVYKECHIWLGNVCIWTSRSPRADQLESSDYNISVSNPRQATKASGYVNGKTEHTSHKNYKLKMNQKYERKKEVSSKRG